MQITKKNMRIGLGAVLLTLLVIIVVQNSASVTLTFIAVGIQLPLFVVLVGAALIGFGLGWLARSRR